MVLSASRTRDVVHRDPDLLARMLTGRWPVRPGRHAPARRLAPGDVGALVLWTKQPAPMVAHGELRDALRTLVEDQHVLVDLQLTVTGFGGGPVEPGIPAPPDVARSLARILDAGLVAPEAVKLRMDPLATIRFHGGPAYSNLDVSVQERILDLFSGLGVQRVTASRLDHVRYPAVTERLRRAGAQVDVLDDAEAVDAMGRLDDACRRRHMRFHTCVDPENRSDVGCIEGRRYNQMLQGRHAPFRVWDAPHASRGTQRSGCRCTYSLDLASSRGVHQCATAGFGCLYCYARGRGLGDAFGRAMNVALHRAGTDRGDCWARVSG